MTSTTRFDLAMLLMLAAGFGAASVFPAHAQAPPTVEETEEASDATPAETAVPEAGADIKDIDIEKLDWSQLNIDASTWIDSPAPKLRGPVSAGAGTDPAWSSSGRPNGSTAVGVKQPLSPVLDARIGADMTVARQGTLTGSELLSEKLANGGSLPQSSGSAWASITAPGVGSIWDKTAVEARLDPTQEQSKLGTSLTKSVPLSEQYSLTLQNGYNLIQQGRSSLPCADCVNWSAPPVPGIPGRPVRSYGTDQTAKFNINDTGTSLVAGQTLSSADDKWLRKIGAEQKLFEGLSVSGSIGETPQGTANKSLTAGFKKSW